MNLQEMRRVDVEIYSMLCRIKASKKQKISSWIMKCLYRE